MEGVLDRTVLGMVTQDMMVWEIGRIGGSLRLECVYGGMFEELGCGFCIGFWFGMVIEGGKWGSLSKGIVGAHPKTLAEPAMLMTIRHDYETLTRFGLMEANALELSLKLLAMSKQVSPLFTPITELQTGNAGETEKEIISLNEVKD
ncbi:hypothetical protein Tco_0915332 [Tanacetum coccineum]